MTTVSLFILLCAISALAEDIRDYDIYKLLELWKSLLEIRPNDVRPNDVTFYLFTRDTINLPLNPKSNNIDLTTKKTKFVIHGFIDNHNSSWYHHLTEEYLKKGDFNIIQVDWGRVARSFYVSSAQNSRLIGKLVAEFIVNNQLPPENIHLIGHSLGAHIAAFVSQYLKAKTGKRVARITGLDPAGPAFQNILIDDNGRLSGNVADVVDVFHSDGGFYGYYNPLGTFDIYINGGTRIQPDCHISLTNLSSAGELFEDTYCSHTRSYVRFTEIINKKKFSCPICKSLLDHLAGSCNNNSLYTFGAEDINKNMTGVCFVTTD